MFPFFSFSFGFYQVCVTRKDVTRCIYFVYLFVVHLRFMQERSAVERITGVNVLFVMLSWDEIDILNTKFRGS